MPTTVRRSRSTPPTQSRTTICLNIPQGKARPTRDIEWTAPTGGRGSERHTSKGSTSPDGRVSYEHVAAEAAFVRLRDLRGPARLPWDRSPPIEVFLRAYLSSRQYRSHACGMSSTTLTMHVIFTEDRTR